MKRLLIIVGLIVALAIPLTAFAATSDTPPAKAIRGICGIDTSSLSEEQKSEMIDSFKKIVEAKKDAVNKMVANGSITKEQGDAMINSIDEIAKSHQENGFTGGCSKKGSCGSREGCSK